MEANTDSILEQKLVSKLSSLMSDDEDDYQGKSQSEENATLSAETRDRIKQFSKKRSILDDIANGFMSEEIFAQEL